MIDARRYDASHSLRGAFLAWACAYFACGAVALRDCGRMCVAYDRRAARHEMGIAIENTLTYNIRGAPGGVSRLERNHQRAKGNESG